MTSATTWVYDFAEGNKDMKDLLGGKGANLAEMTNLGLPVPPGFTITTEACRDYLRARRHARRSSPPRSTEHLAALEQAMGKTLGDPADPLLVSVRSGRQVLHARHDGDRPQRRAQRRVGARPGRSRRGNERFAWDSYRRLIQMFGKTVLDIDGELFEHALDAVEGRAGHRPRPRPGRRRPAGRSSSRSRRSSASTTGRDFPQDPREQLDLAINAVFDSWNADRAVLYRRQERIPADLGTAVNVCAMVFGNLGTDSGTGVAFTRDPATGAQGVYGDYLQNAQGEDVVAGIRNTVPLADLEQLDKARLRRADGDHGARWRSTTATCATSSSPSSAASCGCCRPASASAPRRPRSSSPPSSSTRA